MAKFNFPTSPSANQDYTANNVTWRWNGHAWKRRTGVGAPTGPQGAQGHQGVQGAQGAQGSQGVQGAQGHQGHQGVQGNQGYQGHQGVQGAQGRQGALGAQGAQGALGAQGAVGNQGHQGRQGAQGVQGTSGNAGTLGAQGHQGVQGAQGAVGSGGSTGSQGAQGSQGRQGADGAQGAQGHQGVQGAQGHQGRQGAQGDGLQGNNAQTGIRGYIHFLGNGSSQRSENLSVSRTGTGQYTISLTNAAQTGNSNYGVVIGMIAAGQTSGTTDDGNSNHWEAFVSGQSNGSFTVRAVRYTNQTIGLGADDTDRVYRYQRSHVDPTRITIIVV